jgi:hypothetical protein
VQLRFVLVGHPPGNDQRDTKLRTKDIKEKCVMRFLKYIYAALFAYCLLSANPALAQFEVSPDHFDGPQTANKNTASAKKAQNQTNSENKTAARKTATKQLNASAQKPSPSRSSANTVTVAAHSTHKSGSQKTSKSSAAVPSLKAQAFPVHQE